MVVILSSQVLSQGTPNSAPAKPDAEVNPWAFNLTIDGYIIPNGQSYGNPVFTASHPRRTPSTFSSVPYE